MHAIGWVFIIFGALILICAGGLAASAAAAGQQADDDLEAWARDWEDRNERK